MERAPEGPEEGIGRFPEEGPPPGETPPPLVEPPRALSRRKLPAPYVTLALILVNGVMQVVTAREAGVSFLYSSLVGGGGAEAVRDWMEALRLLGMKDNALIQAGEYWRLVTAAFLHGGILHLGCNMIGLWNLGQFLEMTYGARRFLIIYVGSALAGSIGSFLGTMGPAVGASGAIFGLLGAGLVFSLRYRKSFPDGVGMSIFRQLLFWVVLFLVIGFSVRIVDNSGHIGGLLGGIALGLLVSSRFAPPRARSLEHWVARVGFAASLAAVLAGFFFMARNVHSRPSDPRTGAPLGAFENPGAGYSLKIPRTWRHDGHGPEYLQFFDERGRVPLVLRIADGGKEEGSGGAADLLHRIDAALGGVESADPPEPVHLGGGAGHRRTVRVV